MKVTLNKEFLASILNVNCESTGGAPRSPSLEEIEATLCDWLYCQESIEIDAASLAALMDDCEMGRDDAARQLAVDAAEVAWRESVEWSPENVACSPVI